MSLVFFVQLSMQIKSAEMTSHKMRMAGEIYLYPDCAFDLSNGGLLRIDKDNPHIFKNTPTYY